MKIADELLSGLRLGRILDVATGGGYFLSTLMGLGTSFESAVGIDLKESAGKAFAETFTSEPRVQFRCMDAAALEFANGSFDTVCIANSLHHMADVQVVLREMVRVLRPGGNFIIREMYRDGRQTETQQTHIFFHHWMAEIDRGQGISHQPTLLRSELAAFPAQLGLREIEMADQTDLSSDPRSAEVIAEIDSVIDSYAARLKDQPALMADGEELRQRLRTVGFHSASSLLIVAKK